MARLVQITCPHCGAGMRVDPGVTVVACQYCRHSSFVQRQGQPPPPPGGPYPTVVVAEPSSPAAPFIALGMVAVVLVTGGIGAFLASARSAPTAPPPVAPPAAPKPARAEDGVPVAAPDPRRADLADLVRQARAVARGVEPRAELTSVMGFAASGGLVDTTRDLGASINFEYRHHDAAKPPGADLVEGRISVLVRRGRIKASHQPGLPSTSLEGKGGFLRGALPDPSCPSQRAFQVAVQSGVPSDAVASIQLYNNSTFTPQSPVVWSFLVEGYDHYRREIDAQSCALAKDWSDPKRMKAVAPTRPTPTAAKPPPGGKSTNACGCSPGDLMCAVKCSQQR